MTDNFLCTICGLKIDGFGHNAEPFSRGRCCNQCNDKFVIPARIRRMRAEKMEEKDV